METPRNIKVEKNVFNSTEIIILNIEHWICSLITLLSFLLVGYGIGVKDYIIMLIFFIVGTLVALLEVEVRHRKLLYYIRHKKEIIAYNIDKVNKDYGVDIK